ncbi:MAG TPA: hypothetical protein PKH65_09165 [Bacteroidia bacterium]|nr:hypothetical protein [Bacteroidia bacterium]
MKKYRLPSALTLILILSLLSCEEPVKPDEDTPLEHKTEQAIHAIPHGDVEIINIDGCQYIVYKETEGANLGYGYMAHKGNCKNPIHTYNTLPDSLTHQ